MRASPIPRASRGRSEFAADSSPLSTVEHFLARDALAVFRPCLLRERRNKAIVRAFSHVGKPEFDFFSTDKLACTELVSTDSCGSRRRTPPGAGHALWC